MKRVFRIVLGLVIVLGIAGAVVFWQVSRAGSGALERWIGGQLQSIANGFLVPQLSFDDLDYEYPGTVRLKKLRLTAEDTANPGKFIDIVAADEVTVALAEVPSVGKPLLIEKIILDKPLFQAVAVSPESSEFVGFSNLIRQSAPETGESTEPSETPAGQPADTGEAPTQKLSDVFQMRLVQLIDGRIVYDPRIPDTVPMELNEINTRLDIEPTEAGTYALSVKIARDPVFSLAVSGNLNLDHFSAQGIQLLLNADLGQEKADYLPPQIQQILSEHEVRGALALKVTGDLPIMQYMDGDIDTELTVTDSHFAAGDFRAPVERLSILANLKEQKVTLSELKLDALQGETLLAGWLMLNEAMDMDLTVKVANVLLEEMLRNADDPEKPAPFAGRLNADVRAGAPLTAILAKVAPATQPATDESSDPAPTDASVEPVVATGPALPEEQWGGGTITLEEGRLVRLPVISDIAGFMTRGASMLTGQADKSGKPRDRVNIVFDLVGDLARFSDITYVGDVVAARGDGTISLDQHLDLTVNGGPVEKMQAMLGSQVGGVLGKITDNVLAYRVTGTVAEPKIGDEVGGGVVGEVGGKVTEGVGNVGKGIGGALGKIAGQKNDKEPEPASDE